MGLHRRVLSYFIAILMINPFISAHAASTVYVFSWTIYDDDIPFPFTQYSDIYYDHVESQGILTNHLYTNFGLEFQYSFFHGEVGEVSIDTLSFPILFVYEYIDSAYLSEPSSIFLMGNTYNSINFGLTEIKMDLGEYVFIQNSILFPEFLAPGSNMIDITSNQETNQLLLIGSDDEGPLSLIYDYTDGQWTEIEDNILDHPGRFGDLALSPERSEALYYNSLDTIISGENATYIFDFETLSWSTITGSNIPGPLISYDIFYHPVIEQYVLLGGFKLPQSIPNNDVWLFDPAKMEWTLIFEELPILKRAENPKFYYNSKENNVVGMSESVNPDDSFILFSLNMERFLAGIEVDFGVPTPIVLAATGITLGIGVFIVVIILLLKRRTLIEIT